MPQPLKQSKEKHLKNVQGTISAPIPYTEICKTNLLSFTEKL